MWSAIGPAQIPNAHDGEPADANLLASGRIQAFAMSTTNPLDMIAGGGQGIGNSGPSSQAGAFATTNGGVTWSRIDTGLSDPMVDYLWMDPSNPEILLAATWTDGIFRSVDAGAKWSRVWAGSATTILNVGPTVWAGVSQGVVASKDDGATWTLVEDTASPVRALAAGDGALWAGLDNGSIVYESAPAAAWDVVLTEPACTTAYDVAANPGNASTAIIVEWDGCRGTGVNLTTTDGGATWSTWSGPPPGGFGNSGGWAKVVTYDPQDARVIYASAGDGLYVSTDGGTSWTFLHLIEDINLIDVPASSGGPSLVVGGDQGLYDSRDGGATWSALTASIDSGLQTGLSVSGSEIFTAVQDFSPETSFDGGATWQQLTGPAPPVCEDGVAVINPFTPQDQYAWSICGFEYSTDGGHTFTFTSSLPGSEWTFNGDQDYIAFASASLMYAVAKDGVYESADAGVTWTKTSWGFANPSLVVVDPSDPATIFVGAWPAGGCCASPGSLYVSHDGGSTWSTANVGAAAGWPTSLAVDPANSQVVLLGFSTPPSQGGGIFVSDDGGKTFSADNQGLFDSYPSLNGAGYVSDLVYAADGSLVMASTADGIYATSSAGTPWIDVAGNVVPKFVTSVVISGGTIFAATYGEGVVTYPLASMDALVVGAEAAAATTTTVRGATVPGAPSLHLEADAHGLVSVAIRTPLGGGSRVTRYQYSIDGGPWRNVAVGRRDVLVLRGLHRGARYDIRVRVGNRRGVGPASRTLHVLVR